MLTIVLGAGGVAAGLTVAVLLLKAARKPDRFSVSRSILIDAPAEKIAPFIDDFRLWGAWSPYESLDPAMKRTRSGPDSGVGAVYEWKGRGRVGSGRMEITESSPSRVTIQLDLRSPMETRNVATFTFVEQGGRTRVVWRMYGPNPFIAKLVQTLVEMDQIVGRDFETGLAALKAVVERGAASASAPAA